MDSVVFSEQVGRGLAGCELRGTVFFGVDRFFHSLHNVALKSLELPAEMFPSWFLDSPGLSLTASCPCEAGGGFSRNQSLPWRQEQREV